MANGKVHHWKHGWIPIDAFAMAVVAKKSDGHVKTTRRPRAKSAEALLPESPKKRTRKPANWVPQGDNVSKYKPPTEAERKALIAKELAKTPDQIRAEERSSRARKPLTKEQKVDELNKRRAARGEGPVGLHPPKQLAKPDLTGGGFTVEHDGGFFKIKDKNGVWVGSYKTRADATAKLEKLGDPEGFNKVIDAQVEASAAEMRRERYRTLTTVDGVDFVTYKNSAMDPMGTEHGEPAQLTRDQMQPLADAYNEIKGEFPGLEPVQVVGVHNTGGAFGITSWDGRRISISDTLYDPDAIEGAHQNWGSDGAIAGAFTDDPEGFARAVMTHELGHALQMQKAAARQRGSNLANEPVTAGDLGIDTSDPKRWDEASKKRTLPRWAADTLNRQSFYAIGNEYEWFAEAFAEGWFNGDQALPQSKAVLAMLHEFYGEAGAA